MHSDAIVQEFTRQSAAFNAAPVMRSAETLQSLLDAIPGEAAGDDWLEVACGPGLISRALAPKVRRVVGVDLTRAMLQVGQREAQRAGLANTAFVQADAMQLPVAEGSLGGAATRFSLHHIPVPARCVREMARVVRPGGWVLLADHTTVPEGDGAAWHQEIERLRDPSHWACLAPETLRGLGRQAGLELVTERLIPFTLEYEEWLTRGSGGPQMRELIAQLLAERPEGVESFRVLPDAEGVPALHLRYWLALWRRP